MLAILLESAGGQGDNGQARPGISRLFRLLRFPAANLQGGLKTVQNRHLAIHQHQVGRYSVRAGDGSHGLLTIFNEVAAHARRVEHGLEHQTVGRVVVHHQNMAGEGAGTGIALGQAYDGLAHLITAIDPRCKQIGADAEPEARTGARRTVDTDIAAHQLGHAAHQRKPETAAAVFARGRTVGLREGLEQQRLLFRWDADAGVGDGKFKQGMRPIALDLAGLDTDMAPGGELDGVAHQVGEHLAEAERIAQIALTGLANQFSPPGFDT